MDDPKRDRIESIEAWARLKAAIHDLADADSEDDAAYDRAVERFRGAGRAYFRRKCRGGSCPE